MDRVDASVSFAERTNLHNTSLRGTAAALVAFRSETDADAPELPSPRRQILDLHPLYKGILQDGGLVRKGSVIGLDADLRRALIAPYDATIRLLPTTAGANDGENTGEAKQERLRVYLTPANAAIAAPVRLPFAGSLLASRN